MSPPAAQAVTTGGRGSVLLSATGGRFVAPFVGIFNTDALHASGSVLDIAAIAAIVGWTILEVVILWAVNLFRRERV